MNIKQVFPDTFDEHMRMVGQGKIDISFSNPFVYVGLAEPDPSGPLPGSWRSTETPDSGG